MNIQEEQKNKFQDPGFGARYFRQTKRMINKNGSFNVKRSGEKF
jgi:hypothetical protein